MFCPHCRSRATFLHTNGNGLPVYRCVTCHHIFTAISFLRFLILRGVSNAVRPTAS